MWLGGRNLIDWVAWCLAQGRTPNLLPGQQVEFAAPPNTVSVEIAHVNRDDAIGGFVFDSRQCIKMCSRA